MIFVIASIQLVPGQRDAFVAEFKKIVPDVLAEDGCIEYGPTVDATTDLEKQQTDDSIVTIVEKWESLDALKAHLVAPHMMDYRERVKGQVQDMQLRILQPA
jgi:quinol monooxygenase YgiN